MPIPEFIVTLRRRIGHDLLWLPGVTAVVRHDDGRVLLTRRADTGTWALPSGIPEPGEQPASACAREVLEETGVTVAVHRLLSVWSQPAITYPNGDRCQFMDHVFDCRAVAGDAHPADDESLEVAWFHPSALPDLPPEHRRLIAAAARSQMRTYFE
ncbi:MAG: NUDIX domain-containing protein [bacterium]